MSSTSKKQDTRQERRSGAPKSSQVSAKVPVAAPPIRLLCVETREVAVIHQDRVSTAEGTRGEPSGSHPKVNKVLNPPKATTPRKAQDLQLNLQED